MPPAYPVAPTAEAALHAPLGAAERAGEAEGIAGGPVRLATEVVGPAFVSREAAEDAYAARLAAPGCQLRPVTPEAGAPEPARALRHGPNRWPERPGAPAALWRLQVTFWRTEGDPPAPLAPARHARRHAEGAGLDAATLRRLAAQPLHAIRSQRPLDIGLFEVRAPESPDLILPDE